MPDLGQLCVVSAFGTLKPPVVFGQKAPEYCPYLPGQLPLPVDSLVLVGLGGGGK